MADENWMSAPRDTATAILARAVAAYPDDVFLDFSGETYTYGELDAHSNRIANGLAALGVKQGDRVGSLLDTSYDAAALWFGVNKLGAINVPVNTAFKGEYLRHQFSDAGVEVVLAEPDFVGRVLDIRAELPKLKVLLQRGGEPPAASDLPIRTLDSALGPADPLPDVNQPADISMLIYTSGTTGPSKGCILSHNYVSHMARRSALLPGRTRADINWSPLPLFHLNAVGGTILGSAYLGARCSLYPRFSVSNFWPEIERSGATMINLLGAMIGFIADAPDSEAAQRCFGQIRVVRGSPFPAATQETWRRRFGVQQAGSSGFGMTEAATITGMPPGVEPKPGCAGMRMEDFDVRLMDDEDNEVAVGEVGEICVRPRRPDIMFAGYWGRPEATVSVFRNLWFHTGDLARFDEDGFMFFVDRKKDYLRRRGENISSSEVEGVFRKHPAVEDVAVHAVPAESEDEVKATLVLKPDAAITAEALCLWSAERLPYFAVPRFFEFRAELPRNAVGRVTKFALRDDGVTPTTWDREQAGVQIARR